MHNVITPELPEGVYLFVNVDEQHGQGLAKLPGVRHFRSEQLLDHLVVRLDEPEASPGAILNAIRAILELGISYPPSWPGVANRELALKGIREVINRDEQRLLLEHAFDTGAPVPKSLPGRIVHLAIRLLLCEAGIDDQGEPRRRAS